MEFKESKAIYLQIAERLCGEILQGKYLEDERIPSVREYAAEVEVNINTMMRSYEYLQQKEVIYNKRGIGYFVSAGAKDLIYKNQKDRFLNEDLDDVFRQIYLLGIPINEVVEMYGAYVKQQPKNEKP